MVSRTWSHPDPTSHVTVFVANEGSSSVSNLQIKFASGAIACTPAQTTLGPGEQTSCQFASQNVMGYVEVWYGGQFRDTIGFDSYLNH